MNVRFPQSLLFYPVIGFIVEILFHLLPLALLPRHGNRRKSSGSAVADPPLTGGTVTCIVRKARRSEVMHQYNPEVAADRVVRAGAVLGVIGGGIRAAGSFAPTLIALDQARTWLYVTIDVCLTAGLLSIYLRRRHRMSAAGLIGFLLALVGLIAARASPAVTNVNLYPMTAAAVAIGVVALALSEWRARRMAAWIPMTFALSLVVGGIGTFVAGAGTLFVASGILFGCAFAAMAITAY